jgi:hypothetical protein
MDRASAFTAKLGNRAPSWRTGARLDTEASTGLASLARWSQRARSATQRRMSPFSILDEDAHKFVPATCRIAATFQD